MLKSNDTVRIVKDKFTEEEWKNIGEITPEFKIGDILEIVKINNIWVEFKNIRWCYPLSCMEKFNNNELEIEIW